MKGHRMSSLPGAQFCPLSPELSAKYGAGRAAAMGRAFHACCAQEPTAGALLARLTDKEAATVGTWKMPTDVEVG